MTNSNEIKNLAFPEKSNLYYEVIQKARENNEVLR